MEESDLRFLLNVVGVLKMEVKLLDELAEVVDIDVEVDVEFDVEVEAIAVDVAITVELVAADRSAIGV